jgi:hypothetical protein
MKKTNELVSMVDYVLEFAKEQRSGTGIYDHAKFQKQPITLGDLVACDLEGNVLEKPEMFDLWIEGKGTNQVNWNDRCKQYEQALDRVVFEGFEVSYSDYRFTKVDSAILNVSINRDGGSAMGIGGKGWVKDLESISDLCGYGLKYYAK